MVKLPSGVSINKLINDLRDFSWEASDILLHYSEKIKNTLHRDQIIKSNNDDPVTLADLKVNEIIIQRINDNYSDVDWDILSEENIKIDSTKQSINSDWLWVLDPLDGTKDFIQGTGNYAMHLALNYKNKPFLGVVLIPQKNELWISDSKNVWCERRDGSRFERNLLNNKSLHNMTLVTSKNHSNEKLNLLVDKIKFKKTIKMGSIGCKIASILRGESDIYICLSLPGKSYPKDWDFAAPAAILKAAGGAVTDLDNNDLIYNQINFEQKGIIIATSNSYEHSSICKKIKEIIRKYDLLPVYFN